jgi:hypothetical protein
MANGTTSQLLTQLESRVTSWRLTGLSISLGKVVYAIVYAIQAPPTTMSPS